MGAEIDFASPTHLNLAVHNGQAQTSKSVMEKDLAGRVLSASPPSNADLVARERERLLLKRDDLMLRRSEIDDQLDGIERELAGLLAYERVKSRLTEST